MQPLIGKEPLPAEFHVHGSPKDVARHQQHGEKLAGKLGLGLRVVKTSGKTSVSMSGISQKQWNQIFGKKKKK